MTAPKFNLRNPVCLAILLPMLTACGASGHIADPTEPFRVIGSGFKQAMEGGLPIESVALAAPLREVRAVDGSFVLTQTPTANIPFYSNETGPIQTMYLLRNNWRQSLVRSVPVRVILENRTEELHGRLAIFPAAYTGQPQRVGERFNALITVTPESLAQMEREGVGFSCVTYRKIFQDWCDWALWISREPLPQ